MAVPAVGYRQWVLSFSGPLAVRLGYDQALLATVAESLARAVMQDMRWAVKECHGLTSVEPLHAGVFTVVQRFRSDLGLYVQEVGGIAPEHPRGWRSPGQRAGQPTELSRSEAPKFASCPRLRRRSSG